MRATATFESLIERGILEIGDGYRAKLDELGGSGPLFLRAVSVADARITYGGDRFRSELRDRLTSKFGLPGDVVITTKGASTGRTAFVGREAPEFVYSPHLSYWRSRKLAELDPTYLRYWARSQECRDQVAALSSSTDMSLYLSLVDQKRLRIELPSIEVQRAIGRMLGALDDKIELNRRMNETLEEIAQLQFDATPRSGSQLLGELVTLARDIVDPGLEPDGRFEHFSIPAYDDGQAPVVEPGTAIKSNKLAVPSEAVLLSKLNPRIPRVWLPDLRDARRPVCSTEFLVALPTEHSSREFVYCLFRSSVFVDDFAGRVAGTSGSHQRVKAGDALSIEIQIPAPQDLEELTTSVRPLLERAAANRRESQTLAELRDALLPKLISGELRVREGEAAVEAAEVYVSRRVDRRAVRRC